VAKRRRKTSRKRPPPESPQEVAAEVWVGQMSEECESLPALVWKRVWAVHGIDLTDPRDATLAQIYQLLAPLEGRERVSGILGKENGREE
jgi:hypothetical protein